MDHILTLAQLAERWDCKPALLRTWRARGKGPVSHKIGTAVVYYLEDVEAWERMKAIAS